MWTGTPPPRRRRPRQSGRAESRRAARASRGRADEFARVASRRNRRRTSPARPPVGPLSEIRDRRRVHGPHRRLRARLDREIREHHALVERERRRRPARGTRASDSSRLPGRVRAIIASATSFAASAGRTRPGELDLDRLRHAQPRPPGDHRSREVRRADAGRERVERAARHGVTVGADDEIAWEMRPRSGATWWLIPSPTSNTVAPWRRANARTWS